MTQVIRAVERGMCSIMRRLDVLDAQVRRFADAKTRPIHQAQDRPILRRMSRIE
jgi:hypothetical protein